MYKETKLSLPGGAWVGNTLLNGAAPNGLTLFVAARPNGESLLRVAAFYLTL